MPTPIRQSTFAGGELDPELWSRPDLEKYASGLRRLRNFIVTPRGSAANRPGTRYAGNTRADAWAWMLPFTFSETDTLVLIFTEGRLQFMGRGAGGLPGFVESSPGVRLEVVTPYSAADLPKLRWAQVGNVIRICNRGSQDCYPIRELVRTGTNPLAFTFDEVTFNVPAPNGVAYMRASASSITPDDAHPLKQWAWLITELWRDQSGFRWETSPLPVSEVLHFGYANAWVLGTTYALGARVSDGGTGWFQSKANENTGNDPTLDATHVWWDGPLSSTPPPSFTSGIPAEVVLYPDRLIYLDAPNPWGLTVTETGARRVARRVYRGRGDVFGYVGEFEGTTFTDAGDLPDFSLPPPQGRNPFNVYDVDGALVRTEYPAVVAYQEQRCVFTHTPERPGYVFLSAVDDYSNFDDHMPVLASDAFEREMAAMQREEIRALVPGRVLLAFTNAAEWALSGGQPGEPISPLSFAARQRTEYGSSWVAPLKVGDDEVLFFPSEGNTIRELSLDGQTGKYGAPDVTVFSSHLFAGRQIVARAWQRRPWSVVWVVLDDGKLLSLSYVKEHQLQAWAWHDTQGAVESVCTVREGAEDALYLSVRRVINGQTKRFIERMDTRLMTDVKRGLFLDAAVSYEGAPASHFAGLGHLEGMAVGCLADGLVVNGLVVQGGAVDLPGDLFPDGASVVHVGLPYASEFQPLDVAPGKGKERVKAVSHVIVEFVGAFGGYVGQGFDKKMEEYHRRTVAGGYGPIPLEAGDAKVPITSSWNSGGTAVLRQTDPLPIVITAVVRMVEMGGA